MVLVAASDFATPGQVAASQGYRFQTVESSPLSQASHLEGVMQTRTNVKLHLTTKLSDRVAQG